MKPITQKDSYGCGIACVAFASLLSYGKAKKLFQKPEQSSEIGFLCRDIINALGKKDLNYSYKYIKPRIKKLIYSPGTIVFIARSKKYLSGHYLCRDSERGWMDPWINFPSELKKAKSGFRKKLPGRAIYAILPPKR